MTRRFWLSCNLHITFLGGGQPKISDVYDDDFYKTKGNIFSGNTQIKKVSGLGPIIHNASSLSNLFNNCTSLTSIDASDWNTKAISKLEKTFNNCIKLSEIKGLENIDTSNVTSIAGAFQSLNRSGSSYVSLNLENWDTSNVTFARNLFYNAKVKELGDLSKWNLSKNTSAIAMFANLQQIESIGSAENWGMDATTSFVALFAGCNKLRYLGNVGKWNISNVTSLEETFFQCKALSYIGDLSNWDTSKVTNMSRTFLGCQNLQNIGDLSKWDFSKVTTTYGMFYNCNNIENLHKYIPYWDFSNVTNTALMFYTCSLEEIVFPKNIKVIGTNMYANNWSENLNIKHYPRTKDLIIPDSVIEIQNEAFLNQNNIETMYIGPNVSKLGMGDDATYNDIFPDSLIKITVSKDNRSFKSENNMVFSIDGKKCYGGANKYFAKFCTELSVPEGVEVMVGGAFRGFIDSDEIMAYMDSKGYINEPFYSSDMILTKITLPSTITYIGDRVLQYAYRIKDVFIKATEPPRINPYTNSAGNIYYTFLGNCDNDLKIYVPTASLEKYKAATDWQSYKDKLVGF